MVPIDETASDRLRFAASPSIRLRALALIGLGGSAAAAGLLLPRFSSIQELYLMAGAVAALIAGWLHLLWVEKLEVDPRERAYHVQRGLRPFARPVSGSLDGYERLRLMADTAPTLTGDERPVYSLWAEGPAGTLTFFTRWDNPSAPACAERVAGHLFLPLDAGIASPAVSDRSSRALVWSAWAGMACFALIILWPGLAQPSRFWPGGSRRSAGFRSMETYFEQGWRLYRVGRFAESEEAFRKAIAQYPQDADSRNMLAYALAEQGRLKEALTAAHEALRAAPQSGNILDTVAEMYQRLGDYKTAAAYYVSALSRQPGNGIAESHFKYGQTLLQLGKRQKAIQHLRLAVDAYDPLFSTRARDLLGRLGVQYTPAGPPRSYGGPGRAGGMAVPAF